MLETALSFEILHRSKRSRARVGQIHTPHGIIETPGFVAVGTNGALKGIEPELTDTLGLDLMFCNTYHLMVQPGADTIEAAGGLHAFTGRRGPIITDSGGFQVFSLAYGGVADELKSRGQKKSCSHVLKIDEEGVLFRSYRDGSELMLSPESSVAAQKKLGADIIIPFDELPPYHIGKRQLKESFDRTHRWEERSLKAHLADPRAQAMYSVVHGGTDPRLRRESIERLRALPFDGHAIGGSFGKTKAEMYAFLEDLSPALPEDQPTHLLGIGDLESIARGVAFGLDTFDSSYPTRMARHGVLLTANGRIDVGRRSVAKEMGPIEPGCGCPTCLKYSLGFLSHLFKAKELLAHSLLSIHNLAFMIRYMEGLREQIRQDKI